jgi:hypothetical protein
MKTVKLVKNKTIRTNFSLDNEKKPIEVEHKKQVDTVNKIYLGIDIEEHKNIISELRKKTNSYKTQDEKKDRYDISSFIKNEELYEKLVVSKLRCFYCSKEVKVVYGYVRDDFQWTLDRIDNGIGHSSENTVISCLKCNLQRRVTDCKKFEFTKKLRIKRENYL